jgi:hypothetical protein
LILFNKIDKKIKGVLFNLNTLTVYNWFIFLFIIILSLCCQLSSCHYTILTRRNHSRGCTYILYLRLSIFWLSSPLFYWFNFVSNWCMTSQWGTTSWNLCSVSLFDLSTIFWNTGSALFFIRICPYPFLLFLLNYAHP